MPQQKERATPVALVAQGTASGFLSVPILYSLADAVARGVASARHVRFADGGLLLSWCALGIALTAALSAGYLWRGKSVAFFIPFALCAVVSALVIFAVICLGDMSFAS